MKIQYGGKKSVLEIEAALGALKGIDKRCLPFLNSGCSDISVIVLGCPEGAIRSTKLRPTSRNRWYVPWIIDLVWPLILPHELWGEI